MPNSSDDQLPMPGIDPLLGREFIVHKRDGRLDEFNEARIYLAIESAFKAVAGLGRDASLPDDALSAVKQCTDSVVARLLGRAVHGDQLEVEKIQDAVEEQLMRAGHVAVARRYILYREKRRQARALREQRLVEPPVPEEVIREKLVSRLYGHPLNFSLAINEAEYLRFVVPEFLDYDLEALARHLRPERDKLLPLSGLQKLCDDFLLREGERFIETPQFFWMRIAMGLALCEGSQAQARAVEFYEALSTLRFLPSDAILRHAGSARPRLAVCHEVSHAGAVEQVKDASGAACVWLEPWHSGIFDFLTGPAGEQRLTKGLWLPDLFLKRARALDRWTLFDPGETPDLHRLHGAAFEERYAEYEQMARRGELRFSRAVGADTLWRAILERIGAAGPLVVGFKDTANSRCAQNPAGNVRHAGFGDGLLPNGGAATLGAINLPLFLTPHGGAALDLPLLRATVNSAVRMLDNALELSAYPSSMAREFALENRSIGLGLHGFHEALVRLGFQDYGKGAADFSDYSAEALAACGILASSELALERGPCAGFAASKWSHDVMPQDTFFVSSAAPERAAAMDLELRAARRCASRLAPHRHRRLCVRSRRGHRRSSFIHRTCVRRGSRSARPPRMRRAPSKMDRHESNIFLPRR